MSSQRQLTDKFTWDPEAKEIELLDWETNSDHFNKLSAYIRQMLTERYSIDVYRSMDEERFDVLVRKYALRFDEKFLSLVMYITMMMRKYFSIEPDEQR